MVRGVIQVNIQFFLTRVYICILPAQIKFLKRRNHIFHIGCLWVAQFFPLYFHITFMFYYLLNKAFPNGLILEKARHPTPVLLPGKSHGWRSLVGCRPWGRGESDTTGRLHFHFSLSCIGEGNGNPLQCSCMENPRDGRA